MRIYKDIYFTTATILNWIPVLKNEQYKEIIIEAFRFCVQQRRAFIISFVIMDNHFHVIWQIREPFSLGRVRQNLLKYTAQKIRNLMLNENDKLLLNRFKVDKTDRLFQIWKRDPLSKTIFSEKVMLQKINYIHNNVSRKGGNDLEYKYSSAAYHDTGIPNWDFLGVEE